MRSLGTGLRLPFCLLLVTFPSLVEVYDVHGGNSTTDLALGDRCWKWVGVGSLNPEVLCTQERTVTLWLKSKALSGATAAGSDPGW